MSSWEQETAIGRRLAARARGTRGGTVGDWLRCPSPTYARIVPPDVLTADCREFAGGRAAARAALASPGLDDVTLTVGNDRVPNWPHGITGTITHKDAFAAAGRGRVQPALWPIIAVA